MPKISVRGHQMPESPIRKLVPFAEKAKAQGKSVIHLNIGQPDIKTPEGAMDAIRNIDMKVIEYSHSAGNESYRKGLANYYNGISQGFTHENIMVTTGGSEALLFGFTACFNPGDEVIIPEPFYANYNGFAETCGVRVIPINSSIENGFALPAIEEFEKKITAKTKGILICNPGNPTGYLYSKEELEQLKAIVLKHDLYLFADEVYREFCYDGKTHHSILNLSGIEQNAIVVDSVSKRYSMCGVRIGALVSRNKEVMTTVLKLGQARLSPPSLGQIAAEAALNTPHNYFEEVSEEYVQRRNILVDGLNAIEGVYCPKPGGAFYAVAKLPVENTDHFCQWMLESFEFNGETVMMAPLSGFYSTKGEGTQEVRLAYVLEKEKLKRAVKCLEEGLKAYNKR
ncbi:MAG: pyridoxal phosphate-dependent aminotransferase [Bacteroidetes bacterium]|nr:MAG: pyridoxal phosphate-dependent aminotransferase [Bacteroidota bacterium]MBL1145073.1 pyridoxal phosphate-dependent aminotransferase [Bacteroidota bacterium]NOG57870.1 pyridoxal phosphate-dependent aminotransferase [Bacteroidota bacterium]